MDWTSQITLVRKHIVDRYVFPEVAEKVVAVLAERLVAGAYAGFEDEESFAAAVTVDLQSVNGDKHLRLRYKVAELPDREEIYDEDEYRAEASLDGYGIAAVRRLDGNVGLLDIRRLHQSTVAGPAITAAMNLLASADVLLIDLRRNGGGDPSTVALLCSFLFDEPTHLNDIYNRVDDFTAQFWTAPHVPGPLFGSTKPIYVLTSGETFSGGEELANNLRELKRATLIGEVTRGGANPGGAHRVSAHLEATVPTGRAINPISGTNWEGVGVQPHISVPAADAFDTAYRLALKQVLELGEQGARRTVAEQARDALAELG
jgi:C-terminal processing protease CtpA/Prc